MRAVVCDRYGPPDVLRLAEVAKPDEVLVRVHATTVRFGDKRVVFPIPPRYTKRDVLFLRKLIEEGSTARSSTAAVRWRT